MQIHFLWIKNYKNIIEQGFNFSSKYLFKYNLDTGNLEIKENENYIKGFYGDNISELTAIVGENGTGKTNVIDFICNQVIDHNLTTSLILISDQTIYYTSDLNCIVNEYYLKKGLVEHGFFMSKIDKKPFVSPASSSWEVSSLSSVVIYYSNFVRKQFNPVFKDELFHFDISTSTLLWGEKKKYFFGSSYLQISNQGFYYNEELGRQIKYVCFTEGQSFSFIPKNASISFTDYDLISIGDFGGTEEKKDRGINSSQERVESKKVFRNRIIKKLKSRNDKFYDYDSFADSFYKAVFLNYFRHNLALNDQYIDFEDAEFAIDNSGGDGKKMLQIYFEGRQLIWSSGESKKRMVRDNLKFHNKIFSDIELFLKEIQIALDGGLLDLVVDEIIVNLGYEGKKLFKKLFLIYDSLITEYGFLNFGWRNLSTGEAAFLSLSSRLYEVAEKLKENNYEPKDMIFMIDEGESHFHPQWQKSFFINLKNTLSKIFPDKFIQIILTSHSPFIVSDFLLSNLIFLKRSDEGFCLVDVNPLEDRKATFASNIHTLFTDSFFLKDGLIGDFAKDKINNVIDILTHQKILSQLDKSFLKLIIFQIGEPLIRRKLLQLYEEKLKINIDDEITELKNRLSAIERKGKNDSNKEK